MGDWVERRIGGEVDGLRSDGVSLQKTVVRMHGAATHAPAAAASNRRGDRRGDAGARNDVKAGKGGGFWLNSLPSDSFLPPELRLREGIFDFLAAWRSAGLAMVRDMEMDPELR